ncbi:alpha/beta fold hydrolase [Vallitalea guaymasensis]|uniref:alpha/beta fold hydrolase n=1 Tax=Vallitalea guaymasensis TaxID=1185412 RepID=UPI002351FAAD|nr:alpha/beta fold hydrolase [Vallitalea guaymasensis]
MKYKVTNQTKKKTIIFLNGGGVGPWMWEAQLNNLPQYKMITFDYKGHGENGNKDFISMSDVIDDLRVIIQNEVKNEPVYLIGHSLGAQIALKAFNELPIDKAIIISALNKPMKKILPFIKPLVKCSIPFVRYKWFAKLNAKQLNIKNDLFEDYYNTSKVMNYKSLKNIFSENMSFQNTNQLDDRILVVVGEKEKKIMLESAKSLSQNPIIIKDAVHDIPYNHYYTINKIIESFL